MAEKKYDVIVIGGGPAGYVAAIKAAQLGAYTAVVEKDILGGTCLNRGCIPTKNFLKSAEFIYELSEAKSRGIELADPAFKVSMPLVVKNKNKVVRKLTGGVGSLLKANNVDVYQGDWKSPFSQQSCFCRKRRRDNFRVQVGYFGRRIHGC